MLPRCGAMKYDPLELRGMARVALIARRYGMPVWHLICMRLALQFDCRREEVEARIEALAAGTERG